MIGLGLLQGFAPDLTWDLQHLSNSLDGEASERTEAWELKRKFFAGFCPVMGVLLLYFGITS